MQSKRPEAQQEKIKCIIAYFAKVVTSPPKGIYGT
jgi:hypothetical protein